MFMPWFEHSGLKKKHQLTMYFVFLFILNSRFITTKLKQVHKVWLRCKTQGSALTFQPTSLVGSDCYKQQNFFTTQALKFCDVLKKTTEN